MTPKRRDPRPPLYFVLPFLESVLRQETYLRFIHVIFFDNVKW